MKKPGEPEKGTPLSEVATPHLERMINWFASAASESRRHYYDRGLPETARRILDERKSGVGDGYDNRPLDPDSY